MCPMNKRYKSDSPLVYSTDTGTICPACQNPEKECICAELKESEVHESGTGEVRIQRTTKGRAGKCVTVVSGLPLTKKELGELLKELRNYCGSGGSVKRGSIEIQGDHREKLKKALEERGWKAKFSGG